MSGGFLEGVWNVSKGFLVVSGKCQEAWEDIQKGSGGYLESVRKVTGKSCYSV